ncbi:asparagine synthetase B family protein [Portibacter lacus]|uniref:asparagine synthase (glutamine-hydrolyzing) n=1 Tax=Portibacter lacus TaxID=1099794 RepID=A0AA37SPK1_9BACT|nr:asparagine synthase-related protein [Portibacter lacus]GLR18286.1 asparagine synthetase B [Portibacter lacus]
MPIKQQNRYSGVIFKNQVEVAALSNQFSKINDHFYLQSNEAIAFDGYIPGEDSFSHAHIDRYNGSWSVCEILENELILSRDRIGVRSIYYWEDENHFAFANEIKGLLQFPFVPFKVSKQGAHEFFFSGKTSGLIEGVHELGAGEMLTFSFSSLTYSTKSYFNRAENTPSEESIEEISEQIRDRISKVIQQIEADSAELGAFLSGGIDSSVIAATLALNEKQDRIPFITAMTSDESLNEVEYAEEVVKKLGITEWHQVVAQNIESEIENLHVAMELPTTSLGSFLQYEMMRFCKYKGINEVLDGTGADALFAGHYYHLAIYWNSLIRKGKVSAFVQQMTESKLGENSMKFYIKNLLKYHYFPRVNPQNKRKLDVKINPLLLGLNSDLLDLEVASTLPGSMKNLNSFLAYEFYDGAVANLLRFNDRIGRHFGVMNHSIFSEYSQIFEYALAIPQELKIKNGFSKYVLRNAYSDILPQEVLRRKDKMGLVAPNNYWMKKHKDLLLSYFTEDLSPFFDVEKMKKLLGEAIDESDAQENYKIFKFISFAIWHKVMSK